MDGNSTWAWLVLQHAEWAQSRKEKSPALKNHQSEKEDKHSDDLTENALGEDMDFYKSYYCQGRRSSLEKAPWEGGI